MIYIILLAAAGVLCAYLYARESRKLKYVVQRAHVVWNDPYALQAHYFERRQRDMDRGASHRRRDRLIAWRAAILRKHDDA